MEDGIIKGVIFVVGLLAARFIVRAISSAMRQNKAHPKGDQSKLDAAVEPPTKGPGDP